jgi:hypothetical protein
MAILTREWPQYYDVNILLWGCVNLSTKLFRRPDNSSTLTFRQPNISSTRHFVDRHFVDWHFIDPDISSTMTFHRPTFCRPTFCWPINLWTNNFQQGSERLQWFLLFKGALPPWPPRLQRAFLFQGGAAPLTHAPAASLFAQNPLQTLYLQNLT